MIGVIILLIKNWDIFLADITFADFSGKKKRPVLIFEVAGNFYRFLMTTHSPRNVYEFVLKD